MLRGCVTLSVTEKYVAGVECTQDMLYTMLILESMGLRVNDPLGFDRIELPKIKLPQPKNEIEKLLLVLLSMPFLFALSKFVNDLFFSRDFHHSCISSAASFGHAHCGCSPPILPLSHGLNYALKTAGSSL